MKIKNKAVRLIVSYLIIIVAAYLLSIKFLRFDLTSEGRYTLSKYTKNILENLNDKIYVKVYLTGEGLPITLKNYKRNIKEELDEFKVFAGENLDYEFIDPSESKDKEVRFGLYKSLTDKGLLPIETSEVTEDGKTSTKMVFPGALISYKGKEIAVNLLKSAAGSAPESEENVNNSVQSLEYELTNAVQKLSRDKKPEIAFIEGHGELNEYQLMDISTVLSEYYTVKTGKLGGRPGILDEFKAVIIAKPMQKFSEQDKFVIDQYLMKGGNVMWLLDGTDTNLDSLFITSSTIALPQDNNLDDMLFQYGVRVNKNLLLDKFSSAIGITMQGPDGKPYIKNYPWYYFPVIVSDNKHVISKYLNYIKTEFVSTIDTVGYNKNVKKTVLLKSSEYTMNDPIPARISLEQVNHMPADNEMHGGRKNLAVLSEGKFTSIFKNRPIEKYFPDLRSSDVIEESKPAKMIVISDGDIIRNEVSQDGKPYPIGFDRFTRHVFKGNKELILNAVNYLCDDGGLMTIRSRELKMRLLNHDKVSKNRFFIQLINVLLPVLLILIFGMIVLFIRKKKYGKK
ncbi:MAG: gliding motility-associated ABC transporter substrate-binding protein GldG [Bacteroidales bacterium]|nr:gliding motility-associated ABC transporter substrate-binding protein GldG [Bacteroidales bacterium]